MSDSKKVGIAAIIWMASVFLSRVIGLVREAVIGRTIGGGSDADVFWTSFILPDFLNYLLAGGALSIVFIPIFSSYIAKEQSEDGWKSFSRIANAIIILLVIFLPLLWILLPYFAPLLGPGFSDEQLVVLVHLTRIILPAQFFHLIGGLLSAALQAQDKHAIPAMTGLIYTISIIIGGLIFSSAEGFAYGVLFGSIIGPFALPLYGCLKSGMRWSLTLSVSDVDVRNYFLRSLPIMLGFSIIVFDDFFLKRLGSLHGEGAVSTLQYAKTLMKVPMGVFGLAFGAAFYPTMSKLIAQEKTPEAYDLMMTTVKRVLFLALGAQIVMSSIGAELATVIYGSRLLEGQAEDIGICLILMSIGLWGWSAQTILARGFYAKGNTWTPTILGTIVTVLLYPLYVFMGDKFGLWGLAGASATAITIYVSALIFLLSRFFKAQRGELREFVIKMAILVALCLYLGRELHYWITFEHVILRGSIIGTCVGLFYLIVVSNLKIPEIDDVRRDIVSKVRRKLKY